MLLGYIVNGQTLGIDITKCSLSDLNGNQAFVSADNVIDGYADISSIVNWATFGLNTGRDYKYVRAEIQKLVGIYDSDTGSPIASPNPWDSLTLEEKQIATQWFVVPPQLRAEIYTLDELLQYAITYDLNSIAARETRLKAGLLTIYNTLQPDQWKTIMYNVPWCIQSDCQGIGLASAGLTPMLNSYVQYGLEGTLEGDFYPGLFDYLRSQPGTVYEFQGFLRYDYQPVIFGTMAALSAKLLDILTNGNYEY